jgi:hypothetical protein
MVWGTKHTSTRKGARLLNRSRCGSPTNSLDPLTTEQMAHYRLITDWFPDGQQALDRIERICREDSTELYLSLVVASVDKIPSDSRPKTVTVKKSTKQN